MNKVPKWSEEEIVQREESFVEKRKELDALERELKVSQCILRFNTLKEQFKLFAADFDQKIRKSVFLNNELLLLAVGSYYDDIYRFKDFSGSKWANEYKQAAYTIKWLAKFSPIQILPDAEMDDEILTFNARFAIFAAMSFLKPETWNKIDQDIYEDLIYSILYRNISGKMLTSFFQALAK